MRRCLLEGFGEVMELQKKDGAALIRATSPQWFGGRRRRRRQQQEGCGWDASERIVLPISLSLSLLSPEVRIRFRFVLGN